VICSISLTNIYGYVWRVVIYHSGGITVKVATLDKPDAFPKFIASLYDK